MVDRLILAAACAFAGAALAQPLADPTRPPLHGSVEARDAAPAPLTRLQSVLISAGRSRAVIDGRAFQVGERVGDAMLVAIEPSHVLLQRGGAYERLTLVPAGVEKKAVAP